MSRTTSIASVRPLGWLARVRAQCSRLAWECPAQFLAAGAAGPGPITALGMGARDDHARQLGGQAKGWCRPSALTESALDTECAVSARARFILFYQVFGELARSPLAGSTSKTPGGAGTHETDTLARYCLWVQTPPGPAIRRAATP